MSKSTLTYRLQQIEINLN
ncbi:hypothetical protein [Sporosarcina sp. ACRSM]